VFFETAQVAVIPMLCVGTSRTRRGAKAEDRKRWQMTAAWKAEAEAKLKELGWSRLELARQIGLPMRNRSLITNMFKAGQTSSVYVPDVSKALGIGMPVLGLATTEAEDVAMARMMAKIRKLAPERRAAVEVIVDGMQPEPVREPDKG
jgi:hypothetical protein